MDGDLIKFRAGVEGIQQMIYSQYPQINATSNKARVVENLRISEATRKEDKENEEISL